jgi:4-amino-4-deoxy-L-arabinose transferase-like glycosyltransferase
MFPSRRSLQQSSVHALKRWGVLLVVGLALLVRLAAAWEVNATSPDSPVRLRADEPGYDNLARELLAGEGLSWPGRVPLYPAWLAGLHYVTGYSYARGIYIQCFVGALAVWLTFVLGRELFGRTAGLLAAFGAAVNIVLVHQSVRFLSEVLFTPLVLAVAIAFVRALHSPTMGRFAWVGLWIGLANLVRPTLVAFPLGAAAAMMYVLGPRRAMRPVAALLVAATLTILPWVIRNHVKHGAVYPLATSNAILWQGSPEYFHLIRSEGYTYLDVWNKVIYGPGNEGNDPGTIEGDRYWTRRALRSIAAEPLVYLRFCLEKSVTYWIGDPNADWGDTFVFNYRALRDWGYSRAVTAQYMLARAFPLVAFAALLWLRPYWPRLLPVLTILAYCTLLHAFTHAEARLSDPLHPLLLVIFAAGVCAASGARVTPDDGSGATASRPACFTIRRPRGAGLSTRWD